jgi:hypothetical protein
VAAGNCPEKCLGGSRRGRRRSIWPQADGISAIRL